MKKNLKDMKWTTLESDLIFDRPWLRARRDKVQLPDGTIHPEYYVLEYPSWINVIAITPEGKFVLVRQYRHGLGDTFFELVAGCVEPGEDPEAGARRELLEETGYSGGEWQLMSVISANPSANNNLTYCYLAQGVVRTSEQHLDSTEDIEVHLLTRDELFELLSSDQIKQALMCAPLWKYFFYNNK